MSSSSSTIENIKMNGKSEPNGIISIPKPKAKPEVDVTALSPFGRPAPKWLRDAEMYQDASGQLGDPFIKEWVVPYFTFMMNMPWNATTTETYTEAGLRGVSYFDPYHVFYNEEIAVMDASGKPVLSDYTVDPNSDKLYVVCHKDPSTILPWAIDYIDKAMAYGATGMFFDDIRKPYPSIASAYDDCHSTLHKHTLTGTNTECYISSTIPLMYKYVKSNSLQNFVILNGGVPFIPKSEADSCESLWPMADALMWENAIYDSNGFKWTTWPMLEQAAEKFTQAISNGKKPILLSWSYEGMDAAKRLDAAIFTLSYARMYDIAWSDYFSLYKSNAPRTLVKELYSVKTGPAGPIGRITGNVVCKDTSIRLKDVVVECGDEKAVTDSNGNFTITLPVNKNTLKISKNGYETITIQADAAHMDIQLKNKEQNRKVYYVAPYGKDINDGMSSKTPWRSINYGDAKKVLKPGDTVLIQSGTYKVPNATYYNCSGDVNNPITYKALGDVKIRGAKGNSIPFILNSNYIVWDGFNFEGSESGVRSLMLLNGKGIEIKNCSFRETAYYDNTSKIDGSAAVVIAGTNCSFHHNIIGPNIYASTAILFDKKSKGGNKIYNNTFDGFLTAGGQTKSTVTFETSMNTDEFKNNIIDQYDDCYVSSKKINAAISNNLIHDAKLGKGIQLGENDIMNKNPMLMWKIEGDYNLKRDSAAVDKGCAVGFAYTGDAPDIGAYESDYNKDYYPQKSGQVLYRTFSNTIVLMNTVDEEQTIQIPVNGRQGMRFREVGYGNILYASNSGNPTVNVTIPAKGAKILQGYYE